MTRTVIGIVVLLAVSASVAANAIAGPINWAREEATYARNYPAFMKVAQRRAPYRAGMLRVIYFSGGIGTYYGRSSTRRGLCTAARRDPVGFDASVSHQLFRTAADERLLVTEHLTKRAVLRAYRSGVLLACKLRGA